jgi:peptidoglycan/LPS O-acetylase OafA/YrhL
VVVVTTPDPSGPQAHDAGVSDPPPTAVRRAGLVVALEGAVGIVGAVVFLVRGLTGAEDAVFINDYGTAAWFAILGGGVLAGGVALVRGRRWGRAIAVVAQILLIPVGFALLTDSGRPYFGAPLLVVVLIVLVLLFSPSSVRWLSGEAAPDADD